MLRGRWIDHVSHSQTIQCEHVVCHPTCHLTGYLPSELNINQTPCGVTSRLVLLQMWQFLFQTVTSLQPCESSSIRLCDSVCFSCLKHHAFHLFLSPVFPHFNRAIHGYLAREDLKGRLLAQLLHFKQPLGSFRGCFIALVLIYCIKSVLLPVQKLYISYCETSEYSML